MADMRYMYGCCYWLHRSLFFCFEQYVMTGVRSWTLLAVWIVVCEISGCLLGERNVKAAAVPALGHIVCPRRSRGLPAVCSLSFGSQC